MGGWSTSQALSAQAVGVPAAVQRAGQSVIDLYVRGANGAVYETWYNYGNGVWGGWASIGGSPLTSDPSALATSDGHEQVFATNYETIKQSWWSPGDGSIGGWRTF